MRAHARDGVDTTTKVCVTQVVMCMVKVCVTEVVMCMVKVCLTEVVMCMVKVCDRGCDVYGEGV